MIQVKSIKPFKTSKNRAIGKGKGELIRIEEDELEEIKDCVEVVEKEKKSRKPAKADSEESGGPGDESTPGFPASSY
jgi:BRCT domain type II-containing protein